jgi:hypothetical protein
MKIRAEQIRAFEAASAQRFEDEMCRHLWEFSPRHCKVIGESGVRTVIRRSMGKATGYGFTTRGAMRLYIDLVFMFGSEFDTDPLFPWAATILRDRGMRDPMARAGRLHAKALEFSDSTAGPDFQYVKEAFKRAQSVRYEDLTSVSDDFEAGCMVKLQAAYPRKYAYVGEPAIRQLVREAIAEAQAWSVSAQPGVLFFVILMFAIGHGFATDPLYPWIERTLRNAGISDPNKRVERLYTKTMTYLDHVIVALA